MSSPAVADVSASVAPDRVAPSPVLPPEAITLVPALLGSVSLAFPNHFANGFSCKYEINSDNEDELICQKSSEVMETV